MSTCNINFQEFDTNKDVYPNPNSDFINFRKDTLSFDEVEVYA